MNGTTAASCGFNSGCRTATLRAYTELRRGGVHDQHAFSAAVRVFRHHHPLVRERQACDIVAEWIEPDA